MKIIFNAVCYIVLCRDTDHNVWVLHGTTRGGVYATRIDACVMQGVEQFNVPHDYGMDRKDFQLLHKALATQLQIWEPNSQRGATLIKDSVFYRKLSLVSAPADLVEHHKAATAVAKIKARNDKQAYEISGATCHYRTTTLTLVGKREGIGMDAQSFINQVFHECEAKRWKIEYTFEVSKRLTNSGSEVAIQVTFQIGTKISSVRKHLLNVFPLTEDNHAS